MKLADKNQARRFISLIDALYEARCRIICLAKCDPEDLFFPDASSSGAIDGANLDVMMAEAIAETQDVYRPNVSSYDALSMTEAPEVPASLPLDTLSIFSGESSCSQIPGPSLMCFVIRPRRAVCIQEGAISPN